MENFNLKKFLVENQLTTNSKVNNLTVHEVYEVYIEDEQGNENLVMFRSKQAFDGELGESLRDNYSIEHQGYANVNLTDADYQFLQEKGFMVY